MEIPEAKVIPIIKATCKGEYKNTQIYMIPDHDGLFRLQSHASRLLVPAINGKVIALTNGKSTSEGVPTQIVSVFEKWLDSEPKLIEVMPSEVTPVEEEVPTGKAPF